MPLLPKDILKTEPLKKDHCVVNPETTEHSKGKNNKPNIKIFFDSTTVL
jgi:hypothetical protein